MSSEKEMDQESDRVGIMGLPEVFYGQNHLFIANKEYNILLDFNAVDSLSYSGYDKRSIFFDKDGGLDEFEAPPKPEEVEKLAADLEKLVLSNSSLDDEEKSLNLININPKVVQVMQAGTWKKKDTSKIKDYQEVNVTSDWTYSSPWKGTIRYLSQAAQSVKDLTNLDIDHNAESAKKFECVKPKESSIPFDMLTPENPILHFGQVFLFESDLEDCGYTMSLVRFRVMENCFYILLRYYLRVDGVRVRIFDTRIFHEFGTDFLHREFQYREATFDQLRSKGFDLSSEWLLSPNQSDMVFPVMPTLQLVQERIFIK